MIQVNSKPMMNFLSLEACMQLHDLPLALTFDDVLLVPGASDVLPSDVCTKTKLTAKIELGIPVISAAMDTVSEWEMCVAMAQAGGLGILHRNLTIEEQCQQVKRVKKYEAGIVVDPVTVSPNATLQQARELMRQHGITGIPVTDEKHIPVGILTNRDVRFVTDETILVSELMTRDNLVTVKGTVKLDDAKSILHANRIEKLLVIDDNHVLVGLITVKDIERAGLYPNATKDSQGRLRCGAATSVGDAGFERAAALIEA
ncbi:MAG: IMP dehydrogenase, partial [Alphaproteobacteria bacterium]